MICFSALTNSVLAPVNKPEAQLSAFICEHWAVLFPRLTFVAREFVLEGNVRAKGTAGRIDVLAYNPHSKRLVVVELKKAFDKNITDQAADYRDFIEDNFAEVYLQATQKYDVELPRYQEVQRNGVEVVLIARQFSPTQIDRVKRMQNDALRLMRYAWFEGGIFLLESVAGNVEESSESAAKKIVKKINNLTSQDDSVRALEGYFSTQAETTRAFGWKFFEFLRSRGSATAVAHRTKLSLRLDSHSFSLIGLSAKGGRRAYLQLTTDVDVTSVPGLLVDDRVRPGQKKKGSLGSERYEVFLQNETQVRDLIDHLAQVL